NALFGLKLHTDDATAGTLQVRTVPVTVGHGWPKVMQLSVVDMPGFAESRKTESRYRKLYARELPKATHVVWVVQAHPRVFRPDEVALYDLTKCIDPTARVTVALTHIDTL